VDIKLEIIDLKNRYFQACDASQLKLDPDGVNAFCDRELRIEMEIISDRKIKPINKKLAYERVVLFGLFEASLFDDFPGLRSK
jgi:hypothetical protein